MTTMTKNGVSTTTAAGQEQYEYLNYTYGRKTRRMVQYDYRHTDGVLFSCVRNTLEECRIARDIWLKNKTRRQI